MATWDIVESELIEWLGSYGGPRYHAVVSDPPYALISITKRFGKAGSAPAQEGNDGRYSRLSGGFMGQTWDGFESLEHYQKWVSQWSKLMIERLLYPPEFQCANAGTALAIARAAVSARLDVSFLICIPFLKKIIAEVGGGLDHSLPTRTFQTARSLDHRH